MSTPSDPLIVSGSAPSSGCHPLLDNPLRSNPLRSRSDLQAALETILAPLAPFYIPGGSGPHLGATGVRYSQRVASMEGQSRLLWGLAPLLAGGGSSSLFEIHRDALIQGTDPSSPWYWGRPTWADQIHVEMASISLALLIAGSVYWDTMTAVQQDNLAHWLSGIQEVNLPDNNWHFFRILVCLALRSLGRPVDVAAEAKSFGVIESCYQAEGWYVDGVDENYDWYNPFGFHFYGLIYAVFAASSPDVEVQKRGETYRQRARDFARQFVPCIDPRGPVVPWGRSLAYRFGVVSFFSACAFAGLEVLAWGEMKGVVLRHLRWWFSLDAFDGSGLLSVGYAYPNLIMAEQYNSPSSSYWALKTFLVLALGEDHPFWTSPELPLPAQPALTPLGVSKYLAVRTDEDTVLLCPGRYPGKEMVQGAAKYSKFAYSARFGFCVSHGAFALEKTGCDSMLVLSEGDGYWRERRHARNQACGANWVQGEWNPWKDVEIRSTIFAKGGWQVRIHRIESARSLEAVEGGWSLPIFQGFESTPWPGSTCQDGDCLITQAWGASRIIDLGPGLPLTEHPAWRSPEVHMPEPNLNILHPLVMIPILRGRLEPGLTWWVCAVRAGDEAKTEAELPPQVLWEVDSDKDEAGAGVRACLADAEGKVWGEWVRV